MRAIVATLCCVVVTGCVSLDLRDPERTRVEAGTSRYELRLIGTQTIAHDLQFAGTTVGGLSGIDYDPVDQLYYLISDDRSHFSPARFYTAKLAIDDRGFHDATLQSVVTLLRADGTSYPENTSDSEAIRFDGSTRTIWWTSEGARKIGASKRRDGSRLIDPFVRRAALDGRYVGEVPLAPMFHITEQPRGPRDNLVFEGLTLAVDARSLWVSMEGPLLQDGPMPTKTAGAWSRISRHDRNAPDDGFGALQSQYAYPIDPIPTSGALTESYAQNGVSEILAIDATHFFVLERALVLGAGWRIRLFEADWSYASDVKDIDTLTGSTAFTPMTKRLVLDFDALKVRIANLEGLCFGPTLANGHRTLVLVSDNNFSRGQITQLLALEVIEH